MCLSYFVFFFARARVFANLHGEQNKNTNWIALIGDICETDIEVYGTIEISKKCVLEGWCTGPEAVIVSNSIWRHIAKIL